MAYAVCIAFGSMSIPNRNVGAAISVIAIFVGWHYIGKGFRERNN